MQRTKTADLAKTAMFTAIIAVLSQIAVPLGFTPVPVSLGTLGILLAAGLLNFPYGIVAVSVYILLGTVGLPVFANFGSGIGTLAGPTGGFILGYLVAAIIVGLILKINKGSIATVLALIAGTIAIYLCGVIGFMVITGNNLSATIAATVLPFLLGDAIKIVVSFIAIRRIKPIINKEFK